MQVAAKLSRLQDQLSWMKKNFLDALKQVGWPLSDAMQIAQQVKSLGSMTNHTWHDGSKTADDVQPLPKRAKTVVTGSGKGSYPCLIVASICAISSTHKEGAFFLGNLCVQSGGFHFSKFEDSSCRKVTSRILSRRRRGRISRVYGKQSKPKTGAFHQHKVAASLIRLGRVLCLSPQASRIQVHANLSMLRCSLTAKSESTGIQVFMLILQPWPENVCILMATR